MVTKPEHISLPESCLKNALTEESEDIPNGLNEDDICGTSSELLAASSAATALCPPSPPQEEKVTNKRKANTKPDATDDAAKSVNYRRSTRVSAIKAAERIKHRDSLVPIMEFPTHSGNVSSDDDNAAEQDPKPPLKIRRIAAERILDQCSSRFSIKLDQDEVVLMTSESEFSSIDEDEYEQLKKSFDKTVNKEPTEKSRTDKILQIKKEEAKLRREEAKLVAMKKIASSYKITVKQVQDANTRKATANIAQNGTGTAYKPPIANPQVRSSTSTSFAHSKSTSSLTNSMRGAAQAASLLNLTPQQQQLIQNMAKSGLLNPAAAHLFLQQMQQSSQLNGRIQQQQNMAFAAAAHLVHQQAKAASTTAKENPAQKAAAAKLSLRRQLEQQLLEIPPPHPPPPDMNFIPNGTQPDFCALLGLDIVVQRLLKDRNATRRVSESPYNCEECGTDYTPQWRAIGPSEDSLHLYCEACVKAAQKKKMRMDHTTLLRRAFEKVLEKEQELERKIAEGKFDVTPSSSGSTSQGLTTTSSAVSSSNTQAKNTASLNAVSSSSKSHASQQHQHSSKHPSQQQQSSNHIPGLKRSASGVGGSASAASIATSLQNAAAAMAVANSSHPAMLQQHLAAAAMRHTTPMLAAMMANPLLNSPNMLPVHWNPVLQGRFNAMHALATAVQNVQQGGSSTSNSTNSAQSMNAVMHPFAALASMSPGAMLNNPHMIRQIQSALGRGAYDTSKAHGKK